ncbi:putative holin-like toxin [Vagococcus allomyrinae]
MPVFEALALVISFAMLVIAILNFNQELDLSPVIN